MDNIEPIRYRFGNWFYVRNEDYEAEKAVSIRALSSSNELLCRWLKTATGAPDGKIYEDTKSFVKGSE
jgi:hypothetical protein